jgi:hypothetical protein
MKKIKSSSSDIGSVKTDFSEKAESKSTTSTFENASIRIENNGYNISVKPIAGQNSFFNFTSPDGQIFHGTTNAEINFEKKAEKQESIITSRTQTVTTYLSQITYKSQKTYKTIFRYLDKEKEAYPWYFILVAGFMLREIIGWFWKWFKNSQWYLKLIPNNK